MICKILQKGTNPKCPQCKGYNVYPNGLIKISLYCTDCGCVFEEIKESINKERELHELNFKGREKK